MPRFLIDTSCMVAAVSSWHEHHDRARREIERRLDGGEVMIVAGPGLVEAYAVLTRLPPPHRLSPAETRALLTANFMADGAEIVALQVEAYVHLVQSAPERNIAGGAIFDAVIHACGRAGPADVLLTFNERQFRAIGNSGIQIVVPP